jgi:hypothetical protein
MDVAHPRPGRFAVALAVLGILAAVLWYGVERSAPTAHYAPPLGSSSAPLAGAAMSPATSSVSRRAVEAYLARLGRVDAPLEARERGGWRVVHALPSGTQGVPPSVQRLVNQAIHAYRNAAARVRELHPPIGFEAAQHLLVSEYDANSRVYALTARLVADRQSGADPTMVVAHLEQVITALQRQKRLVPATRSALRRAAQGAGVRPPAWVAGLAYHSWPRG